MRPFFETFRQRILLKYKSVTIKFDPSNGTTRIASKPETFFLIFFFVLLTGLICLPFSSYKNDFFAYAGLLFVFGLTICTFLSSIQIILFDKSCIRVRKGFKSWYIPLNLVKGGYTVYKKSTSRASLESTHFLNVELKVDLPNDKNKWIRNGSANIFHYGFNTWGSDQNQLWDKFQDIFEANGIPILTKD